MLLAYIATLYYFCNSGCSAEFTVIKPEFVSLHC